MKLVVGLGNPGKRFAKDRHNVGHIFISSCGKELKAKGEKRNQAKWHKTTVFMNDSGKEVGQLAARYQVPTADLLIVHDDMDLPLGEFRLQFGRSAAGHKGVQSIIDALGTQDFWRLRIGIGRPPVGVPSEDYVLSPFSAEGLGKLYKVLDEAVSSVSKWLG